MGKVQPNSKNNWNMVSIFDLVAVGELWCCSKMCFHKNMNADFAGSKFCNQSIFSKIQAECLSTSNS